LLTPVAAGSLLKSLSKGHRRPLTDSVPSPARKNVFAPRIAVSAGAVTGAAFIDEN